MKFGWVKARQTKYTAYATVYILVTVGVLAAANWLANRHNKSYDSTKNKRYSLSDQTHKIVKNLKQDAKIYYFEKTADFSRNRDLLDRYDNLSTRLKVEYVDPDKKPLVARQFGVRTYGSVYVEAGAKREEARGVSEEEITGALIRASKTGERNACFVSGSGEHGLDDTNPTGFSAAKDTLEKNNYKTRSISLIEKPEVPKDCTVLLIAGPSRDYVPDMVKAVKTYVENGGRAMFMLDPPLAGGKQGTTTNPELVKMLEGWGVTLANDLVLDLSLRAQLSSLGATAPLVSRYETHPIVREMKGLTTVFPMSRSLDVKSADKVTPQKLFSTTESSFATSKIAGTEVRFDPDKDKKGPFALAAAGSYNTGKPNQDGRFVVVGTSEWAANGLLPVSSIGNRDLFLNMMNWLSSDEDLISIRPKDPEDQSLALTRAHIARLWYSSIIALPLLVVAGGFLVWWRRR